MAEVYLEGPILSLQSTKLVNLFFIFIFLSVFLVKVVSLYSSELTDKFYGAPDSYPMLFLSAVGLVVAYLGGRLTKNEQVVDWLNSLLVVSIIYFGTIASKNPVADLGLIHPVFIAIIAACFTGPQRLFGLVVTFSFTLFFAFKNDFDLWQADFLLRGMAVSIIAMVSISLWRNIEPGEHRSRTRIFGQTILCTTIAPVSIYFLHSVYGTDAQSEAAALDGLIGIAMLSSVGLGSLLIREFSLFFRWAITLSVLFTITYSINLSGSNALPLIYIPIVLAHLLVDRVNAVLISSLVIGYIIHLASGVQGEFNVELIHRSIIFGMILSLICFYIGSRVEGENSQKVLERLSKSKKFAVRFLQYFIVGSILMALAVSSQMKWVGSSDFDWTSPAFMQAISSGLIVLLAFVVIVAVLGARSFLQYEELSTAHDELEAEKRRVEALAITDKLSGLYNRIKLDETIDQYINLSERYSRAFSILILDIDHFKKVNDTYGHQVGDVVIRQLSDIIRQTQRKTDISGRWGGEEFLIICPETSVDGVHALAEKIRTEISTHIFDDCGHITVSAGITEWKRGDSETTLLRRADDALYIAKNKGRDLVEAIL